MYIEIRIKKDITINFMSCSSVVERLPEKQDVACSIHATSMRLSLTVKRQLVALRDKGSNPLASGRAECGRLLGS